MINFSHRIFHHCFVYILSSAVPGYGGIHNYCMSLVTVTPHSGAHNLFLW